MLNLNTKALGGLFFLFFVLGLSLFLPAGSIFYWQAWVYLVLFFISTGYITFYLMKKDPALLQRRVYSGPMAEREGNQKRIQLVAQFAFLAVFLVSAFDHRFGWSDVPAYVVMGGNILLIVGLFIVFLVFKINTFTSAIVEVDIEQKVVSTGPYAVVRHPMYSGALLMLIGTPIALGSWWGLLTFIPMAFVIVLRLFNEERFLLKNLHGYAEYCAKVRWRLLPGIF